MYKFVVYLLSTSLLYLLIATPVLAGFAGGNGTANSPYLIETPEHLHSVRNQPDSYFKLASDISLDSEVLADSYGDQWYDTIVGWEPIGEVGTSFRGQFDGNDHKIKNIYINRTSEKLVGLFGLTNNGEIKNLQLSGEVSGGTNTAGLVGASAKSVVRDISLDVNITAKSYAGGVVGEALDSNFRNIQFSGVINAESYVGGIAGLNDSSLFAEISVEGGNIEGNGEVGGLIGSNKGKIDTGVVSSSFEVIGSKDRVGGVVGINNETGVIRGSNFSGEVTGGANAGGIAGLNVDSALISNSFSTGTISGEKKSGGIVGENSGELKDVFFSGYLMGDKRGGIVSFNNSGGKVERAYTVGEADSSDSFGLVAYNNSGVMNAIYYDTYLFGNVPAVKDGDTGGIKALSTFKMTRKASFENWDFEKIWDIGEATFPYLKWQNNFIPGPDSFYYLQVGASSAAAGTVSIKKEGELVGKGDSVVKHDLIAGEPLELETLPADNYTFQRWGINSGYVKINKKYDTLTSVTVDDTNSKIKAQFINFPAGDGTAENPFYVKNADQLNRIRNHPDSVYLLVDNIDLSRENLKNETWYDSQSGWRPIGTADTPFTGVLTGDTTSESTISNLFFDRTSVGEAGLFGNIEGAVFSDFRLEKIDVSAGSTVGGLAGRCGVGSEIFRVEVTGEIDADTRAGGLVGINNGLIELSTFGGNIWSAGNEAGGIAGFNEKHGRISKSFNEGTVTGQQYVGGLTGTNKGVIELSAAAGGRIKARNNYAGGLVGISGTSSGGTVAYSYSTANVATEGIGGGIVGVNNALIKNTYYAGNGSGKFGGISGNNSDTGVVKNSYYDSYTAGQSVGIYQGDTGGADVVLEGLSTHSMIRPESYEGSGWDFSDTWGIKASEKKVYPFFSLNDIYWQENNIPYPLYVSLKGEIKPESEAGTITVQTGGDTYSKNDFPISGLVAGDTVKFEFEIEEVYSFKNWSDSPVPGKFTTDTTLITIYTMPDTNITVFANSSDRKFASGSGRKDDPYIIKNPEHLYNVRDYSDSFFEVNSNIDLAHQILKEETWYDSKAGWLPIDFGGSLEGKNKRIENIFIDRPATAQVGLFGVLRDGATLNNINLFGGKIKGDTATGSLAGRSHGSIKNCLISGTVAGGRNTGGVVGISYGIQKQVGFTAGKVNTEYSNVGGVVGNLRGDNSLIKSSYSLAKVSGGGGRIGGLVGQNSGKIKATYVAGKIKSGASIVGYNKGDTGVVIDSYFDTFTTGQARAVYSGDTTQDIKGLSSYDLVDKSNYAGSAWDFSDTWSLSTAHGDTSYPHFHWQDNDLPFPVKFTLNFKISPTDDAGQVNVGDRYYNGGENVKIISGQNLTVNSSEVTGHTDFNDWKGSGLEINDTGAVQTNIKIDTNSTLEGFFDIIPQFVTVYRPSQQQMVNADTSFMRFEYTGRQGDTVLVRSAQESKTDTISIKKTGPRRRQQVTYNPRSTTSEDSGKIKLKFYYYSRGGQEDTVARQVILHPDLLEGEVNSDSVDIYFRGENNDTVNIKGRFKGDSVYFSVLSGETTIKSAKNFKNSLRLARQKAIDEGRLVNSLYNNSIVSIDSDTKPKGVTLSISLDDKWLVEENDVNAQDVVIARLDEEKNRWDSFEAASEFADNKIYIEDELNEFSVFALLIKNNVLLEGLEDFKVGPNPFEASKSSHSDHGLKFQFNSSSSGPFKVEIYTLTGRVVFERVVNDSFKWRGARELASGYYIYRVKDRDSGTERTGKLAVIR